MTGCGVCAGMLSRWLWLSEALLAGLIAFSAGDCTSFLMPFTPGDPAVLVCAVGSDGTVADAPRGPLKGLLRVVGVPVRPAEGGLDDRLLFMLSRTCLCCLSSASLSTMTPGVAELRAAGVFGSDTGLCRSLSFSACFGCGAGEGAAVDMLSLSFGCGGSSTFDLAAASR